MNPYFRFEYDDYGPTNPSALCAWPRCPFLPTKGTFCPLHAATETESMTESKRTTAALSNVQSKYPTAVIDKINDRTAKGRPDAQIICNSKIVVMEFKDADKDSPEALMNTPRGKLQHYELKRRARAGAVALLVVFRGQQTTIYDGSSLALLSMSPLVNYLSEIFG